MMREQSGEWFTFEDHHSNSNFFNMPFAANSKARVLVSLIVGLCIVWLVLRESFLEEEYTKIEYDPVADKASAVGQAFSNREYINHAFEIVEVNALYKDSIDLQLVKNKAYEKLSKAESIEDCYSIVGFILRELQDGHSFFMSKERVANWTANKRTFTLHGSLPFEGKTSENIGVISLGPFNSGNAVAKQDYADSLQKMIKSLDNPELDGWIVDLRENSGGNCWPMLAGLGPLIGEGIMGFFVKGDTKEAWFNNNGEVGYSSSPFVKVNENYSLFDDSKPIAVLIGPSTGSSGEIVTTAFKKKANVRFFGKMTAGLTTSNSNFKLKDGSMIVLTTAVIADRKGSIVYSRIIPDEIVEYSGQPYDPAIELSSRWIKSWNQ